MVVENAQGHSPRANQYSENKNYRYQSIHVPIVPIVPPFAERLRRRWNQDIWGNSMWEVGATGGGSQQAPGIPELRVSKHLSCCWPGPWGCQTAGHIRSSPSWSIMAISSMPPLDIPKNHPKSPFESFERFRRHIKIHKGTIGPYHTYPYLSIFIRWHPHLPSHWRPGTRHSSFPRQAPQQWGSTPAVTTTSRLDRLASQGWWQPAVPRQCHVPMMYQWCVNDVPMMYQWYLMIPVSNDI